MGGLYISARGGPSGLLHENGEQVTEAIHDEVSIRPWLWGELTASSVERFPLDTSGRSQLRGLVGAFSRYDRRFAIYVLPFPVGVTPAIRAGDGMSRYTKYQDRLFPMRSAHGVDTELGEELRSVSERNKRPGAVTDSEVVPPAVHAGGCGETASAPLAPTADSTTLRMTPIRSFRSVTKS
ncbi:hypothetical protein OH77DRAFT_1050471 [Trametes cingulata]|nr:hypothetical protein OH77DRAFT_1050471 [Trametes cingulata]